MTRILVIGGGSERFARLEEAMRAESYHASYAATGADGIALAQRGGFELVLLDLLLPDMRGTEVCRQIKRGRTTRDITVVVLTSIDTEVDRIVAFELGAVDYVVEPFSTRELLLRLRVALERASTSEQAPRTVSQILTVDMDTRRAIAHDREVSLSPREIDLLTALYARRGVVQSRAALRDAVWGSQGGVSLRTVDATVKRLRHKLGAARTAVETVRGIGYRFRDLDAEPPPAWTALSMASASERM